MRSGGGMEKMRNRLWFKRDKREFIGLVWWSVSGCIYSFWRVGYGFAFEFCPTGKMWTESYTVTSQLNQARDYGTAKALDILILNIFLIQMMDLHSDHNSAEAQCQRQTQNTTTKSQRTRSHKFSLYIIRWPIRKPPKKWLGGGL